LTAIAHIGAGVVGAFLLDTFVFHQPVTTETLALAVGLSLLPDLDAPVRAALKRNWPCRERNDHHSSFTHAPFFYLTIALMLVPLLSVRGVTLFSVLAMIHLILDSWATDDGIMWLWPHKDRQYALLPVPVRDDDVYGWRYYRYHYFQERRHAAWAEVGLVGMGLVLIACVLLPLPCGL
jgi:membrane-bound metal-dependent hydrolase YbcI (DUF457 family)